MSRNFQAVLLDEFRQLFAPVAELLSYPNGSADLLRVVGWDLDAISNFPSAALQAAVDEFEDAYPLLVAAAENPPARLEEFGDALNAVLRVTRAVARIARIFDNAAVTPAGFTEIGADLLGALTVDHLDHAHPSLSRALVLLTVIEERFVDGVFDDGGTAFQRFPVTIPRLRLDRLSGLIRDPVGVLKAEYGMTTGLTDPDSTAETLFPRLAAFLHTLGISATYGMLADEATDFGDAGKAIAQHSLVISKNLNDPLTEGEFGAAFSLDSLLGLIIRPAGALTFDETFSRWLVTVTVSIAGEGLAFSSSEVVFPTGDTEATFQVSAARIPPQDEFEEGAGPISSIGSTADTRLEVGGFAVLAKGQFNAGAAPDYEVMVQTAQSLLLTGSNGDGFLARIVPGDARLDFDLKVGWSKRAGLHFGGSAALELSLPVTVSIGGLTISAVHLELGTGASTDPGDADPLTLEVSATLRAALGAIALTAERVGLEAHIRFPAAGGNFGPADVALTFKLPNRVGIAVGAGAISGGGFISADDGRYAGGLELRVYDVTVKAFGVLDTRLPDGSKGFSFVIVISAEFQPIQLGLGFTLTRVGGLLGINRTVSEDALRGALKSRELQDLLFPRNIERRAAQIIEALQTVFPPAEDHQVFGPTATIAWGTPALVTADLALVLSLPERVLRVLGFVHANLPRKKDDDSALVSLHMSVQGELDLPHQRFAFDAQLYDSKAGKFPVSGDVALRLAWGQRPNFLLSMGGFKRRSYRRPASRN